MIIVARSTLVEGAVRDWSWLAQLDVERGEPAEGVRDGVACKSVVDAEAGAFALAHYFRIRQCGLSGLSADAVSGSGSVWGATPPFLRLNSVPNASAAPVAAPLIAVPASAAAARGLSGMPSPSMLTARNASVDRRRSIHN